MAENSKIEWTTHTFNPWRGCTKVSEGCANCYAETMSGRNPKTLGIWGPNGTRVVASEAMWKEPLKWDRLAAANCAQWEKHSYGGSPPPSRPRVFCASLADVFEEWNGDVRDSSGIYLNKSWRASSHPGERMKLDDVRRRLFALIDATPNLDWLLLTKRPENIERMMPDYFPGGYIAEAGVMNQEGPRPNVWLGTSVENQQTADERIPHLLRVPAAVRFLSMEPLLGPIKLDPSWLPHRFNREPTCDHCEVCVGRDNWQHIRPESHGPFIGWVIVGGESGHNARPMHPDWVRSIRDQCQAAGVPFFFKQWGEFLPHSQAMQMDEFPVATTDWAYNLGDDDDAAKVGKKAAGRLLDGREWSEFPEVPRD